MTPAVLDRPDIAQLDLDGGVTLEELLNRTLHTVHSHGSGECPGCHARMALTRAGAREAVCGGCGTRLS